MGHHCCSKQKVKRGLWSPEEDEKLVRYITTHGHGCWSSVPKQAGLQRCGKSCRLRWINYLRPDLKRGSFSAQEERVIIDVHRILGNRWAQIAKHLPGRTDNEVKNFWNSCIKKKLMAQGLDPKTHNLMPSSRSSNNNNDSCHKSHIPTDPPTTPFTISTNMKSYDTTTAVKCGSSHQPFLTLPPPKPDKTPKPNNIQYQDSTDAAHVSFNDQNPSQVLMGFTNNRSNTTTTMSSTLDNSLVSSYNRPVLVDEGCMWSSSTTTGDSTQLPLQSLQDNPPLLCKMDNFVNTTNEENCHDFDAPFNSSSFDLDLMESALMPCGGFCNATTIDQFQWDC